MAWEDSPELRTQPQRTEIVHLAMCLPPQIHQNIKGFKGFSRKNSFEKLKNFFERLVQEFEERSKNFFERFKEFL